ncbi:MAG: CRISPR-associated endonuclease Cas1 [Planctomycetes bacterium]|nr:CRISPR-associated endonuclease Cas1 [Planctomycetota bacterium]
MSKRGDNFQSNLLPVRMLNEYAYCPRLFYLMYVQDRWADNLLTVDGRNVHNRVDNFDHVLPDPDEISHQNDDEESTQQEHTSCPDESPVITRSVLLSSETLGIIAKLDLVSTADDHAVPVETKRGKVPDNSQQSWEPERVQLMAQGLLLREHGYQCDHGVLYFVGSRTRVDIPFTAELEARTRQLIQLAHQAANETKLPPPLDDSPKCNNCSLAGICLPDETRTLTNPSQIKNITDIRRLFPIRDDALPLYIQEQGAIIGKSGKSLLIRKGQEKIGTIALKDVSQLVLCGNVSITAQTLKWLCQEGIPIIHYTTGHWFCGLTTGITIRNAFVRAQQFRAAQSPTKRLALAKAIVAGKGTNQRTLLRRNATPTPKRDLDKMTNLLAKIPSARSCKHLLGLEGNLAARYYANFAAMLSPRNSNAAPPLQTGKWDFTSRNRRPPKDPINALLSFGYALLVKECTVALLAEGLDPWWGLYHKPRHGRPALALDPMEEFRPLIVDSAVITAVNTGMVTIKNFTTSRAGCVLNDAGRKAFIKAYEARLDQLVTHPIFNYRCSWRTIIRLQAKLLAKWLLDDIPQYKSITTR